MTTLERERSGSAFVLLLFLLLLHADDDGEGRRRPTPPPLLCRSDEESLHRQLHRGHERRGFLAVAFFFVFVVLPPLPFPPPVFFRFYLHCGLCSSSSSCCCCCFCCFGFALFLFAFRPAGLSGDPEGGPVDRFAMRERGRVGSSGENEVSETGRVGEHRGRRRGLPFASRRGKIFPRLLLSVACQSQGEGGVAVEVAVEVEKEKQREAEESGWGQCGPRSRSNRLEFRRQTTASLLSLFRHSHPRSVSVPSLQKPKLTGGRRARRT